MALSRRDLAALLLVLGAAVASVAVWVNGAVDIGMTLRMEDGKVTVANVTPDGYAARAWFSPQMTLIGLEPVDGPDIKRGAELGEEVGYWYGQEPAPWQYLGSNGQELAVLHPSDRWPAEALSPERIAMAVGGDIFGEGADRGVEVFAAVDRRGAEYGLRQSIFFVGLGLVVGIGIWRALAHGLGGDFGRQNSVMLAAATATPFALVPVILTGHAAGIYAGYLVPAAALLLVGVSLAWRHPERAWRQTALAASCVAAAMAVTLVVRYMTLAYLAMGDRSSILLVTAAILAVPGFIAAMAAQRGREQASQLSLALLPVAGIMLFLPTTPDPVAPLILVAVLLGWQLAPAERGLASIGAGWRSLRPASLRAVAADPVIAPWRDRLLLGLLGLIVAIGLVQQNPWAPVVGAGLAALVGSSVRQGILGAAWTDAAVPLAAAVGLPFMVLPFPAWTFGGAMGWVSVPQSLAALAVAHVLAERHSDAKWRGRLFQVGIVMAVVSIWLGAQDLGLALVLAALIPMVPGIPVAFAEEPGEVRAFTTRLEALAIAMTPGVAATVLIPSTNAVILGAWLVAIFIWRRFTLRPLLGLAQRTQLQRDLAVAAAETERARLAADLHDDALQQLTMLVRTLDEGGHQAEADEAREVATKLRSVVGDLRLPILDDLGAGAALEWLVERVEPLAGGPVRLERSDETRPPANVELAVFRVAQEALTNAIKHGRPPIAVRYDVRADGRVTLAVDDAGPGIGSAAVEEAPAEGHFGLANMQQRAEQIGALLDVRRWPAGGTRVALEWRPA